MIENNRIATDSTNKNSNYIRRSQRNHNSSGQKSHTRANDIIIT